MFEVNGPRFLARMMLIAYVSDFLFLGGAVLFLILDATQVHISALGEWHFSGSQRCIWFYSVSSTLPNKSFKTLINKIEGAETLFRYWY